MREADAAKNRFLAILAHELRNLLSPVLTALQAVRLHAPDDPRIQRSLDVATRSINTQSRLVTDLLDLSRIAQGRMEFEREPVELDDLVTTVAEGQREPMERAGLTLEVQTTPGLRTLGDAGRLQQALLNLLSNATKFTPPGGEVRVTLQREGAEAHIVVADTGIGMDEATMRHAFDLFRQGGRRQHGNGAGHRAGAGALDHRAPRWSGLGRERRTRPGKPLHPGAAAARGRHHLGLTGRPKAPGSQSASCYWPRVSRRSASIRRAR